MKKEEFKVKEINHLENICATIKSNMHENLGQGYSVCKMNVEVPYHLHIDEVIERIEETTNLLVSRVGSGLGFQMKSYTKKLWTVGIKVNV